MQMRAQEHLDPILTIVILAKVQNSYEDSGVVLEAPHRNSASQSSVLKNRAALPQGYETKKTRRGFRLPPNLKNSLALTCI